MARVDLRSDTVTQPTPEMIEAMVSAPVGDDVLGDDPSVMELEKLSAKLTNKEAAVFVPSGTMGNQIAIATHTNPGDTILAEDNAHILFYEVGAPAVIANVMPRTILSNNGVISPDDVRERFLHGSLHTPGTTLLCIENTHNRAGGTVTNLSQHFALKETTNGFGIPVHLDGARVFNAAVALGCEVSDITDHVDSVSFCLSKALGAPVGSVLCGSADFIDKARYWRKRLGGGMRQAGILAGAGIYCLKNMIPNLADDHKRCFKLYEVLHELPDLEPVKPETNILMVHTKKPAVEIVNKLAEKNVHCYPMDEFRVRLVFHHQVDDSGLEQTILAFNSLSGIK